MELRHSGCLPLPGLSHSINPGYVAIRFFESLPGAMSMSENSKGTTQAPPPAETSSVDRAPSAKEQASEKNTLHPALDRSHESQARVTTIVRYPIRPLYTKSELPHWDA